MDQLDQKGFSLFPMPPTPPVNRPNIARMILSEQQRTVAMDGPEPSLKHRLSDVQRLRPPPLKLRKKKPTESSLPPSTTSSPLVGFELPLPSPSDVDEEPLPLFTTGYDAPSQGTHLGVPAPSARASSVLVPEYNIVVDGPPEERGPAIGEEQPSAQTGALSKRTSYRKSQWLDGQGELDRKRLSMYLSGVLDPSFEVVEESAYLTPLPHNARASILQHENQALDDASYATSFSLRSSWRFSALSNASHNSRRPAPIQIRDDASAKDCHCPPGVIICKCCSSPEFERFRRVHSEHKSNPSVSSTTCFLSIPRARFRSNLGEVDEMDTPSTPPGLMYDSEDSDEFDWSLPNSPTFHERTLHYQDTPTPAPRQPPKTRGPVPSFSLPFSHGKQIRPQFHVDRTQSSSPRTSQHPSSTSTVPTLASISTVSTFTFDFCRNDDDEEDNQTEYDLSDEVTEISEIRTFKPVQKAKPVLVHCRGPSPQSIKYGQHRLRHKVADSDDSFSSTENWGTGYATIYVR
ncbi:hypothetical protein PV08_04334 [Exophiala spinifera]|uniref:Uncharacterized protein n=1 Tax=Exophiala spinifera TaxID=91928 RepID=A0A0D2BDV9_9EURO|nr:uncharacterized protein PV08_04334 [Exophiala spinifera]KIW17143.1 hypothetical protein PV08_04334 [Exophiala spinifera]